MAELAERLRNSLNPIERKRYLVWFHPDDREEAVAACRTVRTEGYEVAEREHRYVDPGQLIVMDADLAQPRQFLGFDPSPPPAGRGTANG
jgi:hypothetical protein